jgi:hypothetical protein
MKYFENAKEVKYSEDSILVGSTTLKAWLKK